MTNQVNKIRGNSGGGSGFQPLILAVVLILGIFLGRFISGDSVIGSTNNGSESSKIIDLINRVDEKYVDDVDQGELVEKAIEAILEELDPHSYYINYDDYKAVRENMQGNFEGIGVEFMIFEDTLHIVAAIGGGPSEKAGIRAGDMIINVNGNPLSGTDMSNLDVTTSLKGPAGTDVTVSIKRRGEKDLIDFVITRDRIPIKSVVASFMVDDEIGYIKVNRFANTTGDEFELALRQLSVGGMTGLILDLRGNGGGFLHIAERMVQEFLVKNKLIVYTEGRNSDVNKRYSKYNGDYSDIDLVILINQGSASASEIVAGALQDHDRAITVGRRSFGKGLVQHELMLRDSSVVRLTVARYFTPSGRCIQKPYGEGIDYESDYMNRYDNGELMDVDSISYVDSLKYSTDMGRVVFGGGGISPDVFVPIDKTGLSDFFNSLNYGLIFRNFGFNHVDAHRDEYQYPDYKSFDEVFSVDDDMLSEFIEYSNEQGIIYNEEDYQYSKELISLRIKGEIGKNLFDDQARYYINLSDDADFIKGLEVVKNYDIYMLKWMAEIE